MLRRLRGRRAAGRAEEAARLARIEERLGSLDSQLERANTVLEAIVAEDAENRRRLWRLRESPDYERPFTDAEPLVSVTIATHDRAELLRDRALPSVLGQSYERLEVIVVGDHSGPDVERAVASFGDRRVRFRNLTQRIVVRDDPERHWYVGSTMARNEALRMATGDWLVSFDDDDLMYPDLVGSLLAEARSRRLEVAYGRLRTVLSDGSTFELGAFPPRREQFGWQGALAHAGLRVFERELVAAAFEVPGDWYLLERMLRAGVRFGMHPELVCDYFPSRG